MTKIRKTYFITDQLENKFPIEFMNSTNKKYIEVFPPYISGSKKIEEFPDKVYMHADFILRDFYLDHAVCLCNSFRTKYKKYEYKGTKDTFRIWFTDEKPISQTTKCDYHYSYIDKNGFKMDISNKSTSIDWLQKRYPGHDTQIEEIFQICAKHYRNYENTIADSYWNDNNLPTFYATYDITPKGLFRFPDIIDYIANLYGKKQPDELDSQDTTQSKDALGNLVITDVSTYKNYDLNMYYTITTTTKYRTLDEMPFIAEFLLIY